MPALSSLSLSFNCRHIPFELEAAQRIPVFSSSDKVSTQLEAGVPACASPRKDRNRLVHAWNGITSVGVLC